MDSEGFGLASIRQEGSPPSGLIPATADRCIKDYREMIAYHEGEIAVYKQLIDSLLVESSNRLFLGKELESNV